MSRRVRPFFRHKRTGAENSRKIAVPSHQSDTCLDLWETGG